MKGIDSEIKVLIFVFEASLILKLATGRLSEKSYNSNPDRAPELEWLLGYVLAPNSLLGLRSISVV